MFHGSTAKFLNVSPVSRQTGRHICLKGRSKQALSGCISLLKSKLFSQIVIYYETNRLRVQFQAVPSTLLFKFKCFQGFRAPVRTLRCAIWDVFMCEFILEVYTSVFMSTYSMYVCHRSHRKVTHHNESSCKNISYSLFFSPSDTQTQTLSLPLCLSLSHFPRLHFQHGSKNQTNQF